MSSAKGVDAHARSVMNDRDFEEYEASKRRGFVVVYSARKWTPVKSLYWDWCEASNVPFMKVVCFLKYAAIEFNADTTGYPYTFNPDQETVRKMAELVKRHWVARNSSVSTGQHHYWAFGVPNETVDAVASELFDLMRPFIRTPELKQLKQELGRMAL